MNRPDFRLFKHSQILVHSAKGSTWDDHKYIKRIDGTYYYPDSYEGGRHLPKGSKERNKLNADSESSADLKAKTVQLKNGGKGDPDIEDDSNYTEENRLLKDDDFFGFTRKDGTFVVTCVDVDAKWEFPPGTKKEDIINKLKWYQLEAAERSAEERDHTKDPSWAKLSLEEKEAANKKRGEERQKENIKLITDVLNSKERFDDSSNNDYKLEDSDIDKLAKETIKGNFGNGQQRKDLLGESYGEVQKRVNEILKSSGSKKVSEAKKSDAAKTGNQAITKAASLSVSRKQSTAKAPDPTKYLSVYERQALRKRNNK